MHYRDWKVIELGVVSAATRGWTMGFVESELGLSLYPGLHDD
jgi:hypothetical protein